MSVISKGHSLSTFGLADMVACGAALRQISKEQQNMETFAKRATQYFHENLVKENGESACALVRFFITQRAGELPLPWRALLPSNVDESVPCLTLLGTAGLEKEWRGGKLSASHRVFSLQDTQNVDEWPMISQMIKQFGPTLEHVLNPEKSLSSDDGGQENNIFHMEDARGNPALPDQEEFVIRYGIKSVLGFGGTLPSGTLFAMMLFGTVPIARKTADLFRTVALNLRLALLRFEGQSLFSSEECVDV